jgi:hypothetical protein
MKRKSTNYKSADAGGWMNKCDDLFLARYRGKPCAICGATKGRDSDRIVPSCGHHLIFKGNCRKYRYEPKNIIVLCPYHHSHYNPDISPHSMVNTMAQLRFAEFVKKHHPKQYSWWKAHEHEQNKGFDKSWTYREMYELIGGEIETKTGKYSDYKPKNHAEKIRRALDDRS